MCRVAEFVADAGDMYVDDAFYGVGLTGGPQQVLS
jgi:hypothetical protein